MKKIYLVMAVLGAVTLSSCIREQSFNDATKLGENAIAFSVQGTATRSGETVSAVQKGVKIPFAQEENTSFYLEETVANLDYMEPATKGTPVYTENVGVLYANQMAVHAVGFAEADAVYENVDQSMVGNGWRYHHNYNGDPWPDGAVDFYLSMPANMTSNGVTITGYGKDTNNNGTITFTYQSPANAADQQDIIFAYTSLTKDQHKDFLPNGAPVLFRHALTGVKFAIENNDDDKQISIKEVIFNGLKDKGTCTITPAKDDASDFSQYKDVITYYSSAAAVNWGTPERASETKEVEVEVEGEDGTITTETQTVTTFYSYPSGEYADTVYFAPGGSFKDNGEYPASFSAAGHKHNLNDANATQTFWFIPQAMTGDVTLTIKYTYGSEEVKEGIIEFGKALSGVTWNAGELRTYTIRVDDVNVMIDDKVNMAEATSQVIVSGGSTYNATSYIGSTKTDVTITNTGNTAAYIRAAIVGQWLDSQGRPVFGFTDYALNVYLVDSWYQDQFVSHDGSHGYFENLAGYSNNNTTIKTSATAYPNPCNGWYLCNDGYYYYSGLVEPDETTGSPLFTKYYVGESPAVVVAGEVKDVVFELEIATQAVTAKKVNGDNYTWQQAWENALGTAPTYTEITVE